MAARARDRGSDTQVTEPTKAVFLSYASQDIEAAQSICNALGAAGIEVFFDQSELRGGDAWDKKIRREIHDCALFIPIISAHSDARHEGYFRREWRLAVERAGDMSDRIAFLVPVVIDGTSDSHADVPDRFREVQWTRLPGGETPPAFVERVQRLLAPEASTATHAPASAVIVAAPTPRKQRPPSWRSNRVLAVAVAGAILSAMVAYFAIHKPWITKPPLSIASASPAASIAVLPLTNESGDAKDQYFSDGISEDLITALSQFPGLKVIGRTSAFQFRDSKDDSRSIGAKLGVAHLLEGSVRRAGEMVRVSAELIDTVDGSTQWSERYDRPYKDLFALQDEITRAVAGALRAKLLPGEHAEAQTERPPNGSLEAYNALLQGGFYFHRQTEADNRRAIEYYTRATQLDPRYALAWSRLSIAWSVHGSVFLEGAPQQEAYAKAREATDRALALSPDLAAAHIARGSLLQLADFDWSNAEVEFRRALELAPNDGEAKFALADQLATFGKLEQAIALMRQAIATDPLAHDWYAYLAYYLSLANRLDEAEQAIHRAIGLQPLAEFHYSTLASIEVQRGNAQAALAAAQQEPLGHARDSALALAFQIGGDRNAADAALKVLLEKDADNQAYEIAEVYALRNDAKATFEWLDRALKNRETNVGYILSDPFILRFKDDPRFAAFCKKVGLPTPAEVGKQT
jgi:TolB-like protein/Tfp pilus assembly protein PilF